MNNYLATSLISLGLGIALIFLGLREFNNDPLTIGYWIKGYDQLPESVPTKEEITFDGVVDTKPVVIGIPMNEGVGTTLLMEEDKINELLSRKPKQESISESLKLKPKQDTIQKKLLMPEGITIGIDTSIRRKIVGTLPDGKTYSLGQTIPLEQQEEIASDTGDPNGTVSLLGRALQDYATPGAISQGSWITYKKVNTMELAEFQTLLQERGVHQSVIDKNASKWFNILKDQRTKAGLIATAAAAGVFVANSALEEAYGVKHSRVKVWTLAILAFIFVYSGVRYLQLRKLAS